MATSGDRRSRPHDPDEAIPGNRQWGGLARKGALRAQRDQSLDEEAGRRAKPEDPERAEKRVARDQARSVQEARTEALRAEARAAVERVHAPKQAKAKERAARPKRERPAVDRAPLGKGPARQEDEVQALTRALGPAEAKKALRKLRSAAEAFEHERFGEARRMLKPLVEVAPGVAEVRELYGLTLYRLGDFRGAATQLEAFRSIASSTEQHPVLADCYRAQRRFADVEALWTELSDVSPSAALVNEGRIVMAGAIADRGDVDAAVRLLAKGWKRPSAPKEHHLRRAYALADLYERSGDLPRARALFHWIVSKAPDFVDSSQRLRSLR
jgi:tetratricopeptide (TPR) repeat protein